jgi:cytochrome c peroxidase
LNNRLIFFLALSVFLSFACCKDDEDNGGMNVSECVDLTDITFLTQKKELALPTGFQPINQPLDNEMTVQGVLLGRHLFFDPILSADSTKSCGSCHGVDGYFTDNLATSPGIDGVSGVRSSMPLVDLVYSENGLFWDGRSPTLERQALLPVEDPIELHDTWDNVEAKLRRSDIYPAMFRKAFGIGETCDITRDLATKAIAQFERSIISMGNSKFDRVFYRQMGFLSDSEERGKRLFFDEDFAGQFLPDAECFHCHSLPIFTDNSYRNNGLTFFTEDTAMDLDDKGRYEVTKEERDIGLFRVPSLRNVEFTAPYMHDGRFETLEEVLDHYICGIQQSPTLDVLVTNHCDPEDEILFLSERDKQDIIAFLKTLSDTTFFSNPEYQSPF